MTPTLSTALRAPSFVQRLALLLVASLLALGAAAVLAGCDAGGDGGDDAGGATLQVLLTDAPGDLAEARVTVDRVELLPQGGGGAVVLTDTDRTLDLLRLQNGVTATLAAEPIPAGTYTQMRFVVADEATVVLEDGTRQTLIVPSGTQTGIKVVFAPVTVGGPADDVTVLLDFDVEDSFVQAGASGMYLFKPVVRTKAVAVNGQTRTQPTVTGAVTAVGSGTLTVEDVAFAVTDQTVFDDGVADLSDLAAGDVVEVTGAATSAGLEALKVEREEADEEPAYEAELEAVGSASVTLLGQAVQVTAATQFEDGLTGLGDLSSGDRVEVEFTRDASGAKTATEIEREDAEIDDLARSEATGAVTAVGSSTLTVEDVPFAVTSRTRFDDDLTGLGDLAVGDVVEVRGAPAQGGGLEARRVEREDADEEPAYEGALEAVGSASVTLLGQAVQVTAATQFEDGLTGLGDLAPGDRVEVEFTRDASGAKTATKVEPDGPDDDD